MKSVLQEILINEEMIAKRVRELGEEIKRDYKDKDTVIIGVLRGAVVFLCDLVRAIDLPISIDFMAVSSYGASTTTSGTVRILKDLDDDIEGKHVIIAEDIVDTGLTLSYLKKNLESRKPASVKICTLLNKPDRRRVEVPLDYVGFVIPDKFVLGYGLDYVERYRNLPFIGVLKEEIYK